MVINANGYEPYSIIVVQSNKRIVVSQNVRLVFLLTPLPALLHAQSADTAVERTRK